MINSYTRKLAQELGFDQINESLETEISARLDRTQKLDEVDTITFGLETDDGKVVKVFVNQKDAEAFEKIMSSSLGSTDSIEDAINKAAAEVDIVDVEWPDLASADDDSETIDGSEVLDPKVYNKANSEKETQAALTANIGGPKGTVSGVVSEAATTGQLGDRLLTANQQLVYQAIIDLGIPEEALSRSAYRAPILLGIKSTANLLMKSPQMKVALKQLIKHRINVDHKDDVKESLVILESATTELYWSTLTELLNMLDDSQGKRIATAFMKHPKIATLEARSATVLQRKISSAVKTRLQALAAALEQAAARGKAASQPQVEESLSSVEVAQGVSKMIHFVEAKDSNAAETALGSTQGKQLMTLIQRKAALLPSTIKQRFEQLLIALDAVPVVEAKVETPIEGGAIVLGKWSFDEEEAERALKALSNKITTKLTSVDGKLLTLSPRLNNGSFIKMMGTTEKADITVEQHDALKAMFA